MTISYPVSPPSSPKPSRIDWFAGSATAVSMSPFTLQAQAVEHDGASWAVSVTYPPMDRAEAAPWMAFLASLRGRYGTFYFGDELLSESQASPGGSPLTNNPTAGSYTIPTDGWTASTNVLDKGDFISINYRLYMVTADVTSDGATAATIDVWPSARSDISDGQSIVTSDPLGTFRMTQAVLKPVSAGVNQLFQLAFTAEEAI